MTLRTRLIALFVFLALTPFVIASVLLRQQSASALRAMVASTVREEAYWVARTLQREVDRAAVTLATAPVSDRAGSGRMEEWLRGPGQDFLWVRIGTDQILGGPVPPVGDQDPWIWCGGGDPGIPIVGQGDESPLVGALRPGPWLDPNQARVLGPETQLTLQVEGAGGYSWRQPCGGQEGVLDPDGLSTEEPTRLTARAQLENAPVTVWASARPEDFQVPISQPGLGYWLIVLAASLAAAGAFTISIHRVTRSLENLAEAAEQIGAGNFSPDLPAAGRDEAGRLAQAIGRMAEQLRETVDQIRRHGRMAVVGELASYLSHEIRNPLSSIQLNLQGIRREVARDADAAAAVESVDICLREVRRLDRVVSSVLKLGRWRTGEARPVYVHAVLADSLGLVTPQLQHRGIDLKTRYLATDDLVRGDPEQLTAAFLNLFLNSGDAMEANGRLTVETESGDAIIQVTVRDTGDGIPESIRKRIWEPFFTTREEGSGIGLPLAVRTFEEHGGSLVLLERASEEEGATFVIRLPLARPAGHTSADGTASTAAPSDGERVLQRSASA